MGKELSNKEYWEKYWDKEQRAVNDFTFTNIIEKYIDFKSVKSYMEIGGAPGGIMVNMNKNYGLNVSAIDFVNKQYIQTIMDQNGVTGYEIFEENFLKYDLKKHPKRYDIVASWGFIEHFDLNDCKNIINKQKKMVAPNGYLILELPNIRKFNWLIYRICNNSLLKIHNLQTMNLSFLKEQVADAEFDLLYCNYYLTSFLGFNKSSEFFNRHIILKKMFSGLQTLSRKLHLNNIPNSFFSPYIVIIAKKVLEKKVKL